MKKWAAPLLGLILTAPVFSQNGVFKCADPHGAIAYQGAPCQARQHQVTLIEPRKREPAHVGSSEAALSKPAGGAASEERRSIFVGEELEVGMSDTKVLNMRGWGRPKHIARSRAEDGWHEEWTYISRADGATRVVHFLNGKLAGVRSEDVQRTVRATSRMDQIIQTSPRDAQLDAVGQPQRALEELQTVRSAAPTRVMASDRILPEQSARRATYTAESSTASLPSETAGTEPAPIDMDRGEAAAADSKPANQPEVLPTDRPARWDAKAVEHGIDEGTGASRSLRTDPSNAPLESTAIADVIAESLQGDVAISQ